MADGFNQPATYEFTARNGTKFRVSVTAGETVDKSLVTFYDMGYPDKFGATGQHICQYFWQDLRVSQGGLHLFADIPQWVVDVASMAALRTWLRELLEPGSKTRTLYVVTQVIEGPLTASEPVAEVNHYRGYSEPEALAALVGAGVSKVDAYYRVVSARIEHILEPIEA